MLTTFLLLMTLYSPLPCEQDCSIGAEHGVSTTCPVTADKMTLYWLMPTTLWEEVVVKECEPGEVVRFEVAKYLVEDLPAPGLIAYRVTASNVVGEGEPTPALVTVYEGGVRLVGGGDE